jgi:hypothetical protein
MKTVEIPVNELESSFFEGDRAGSEPGAETRSRSIKRELRIGNKEIC